MAKLQRKSAKLFAESATAGVGGVSQFGSLAEGDINYSKDPDVIQALDAYKKGWGAAVLGNKSPAIEDRNALDYLLSYQQAYIMQRGIPEWIATETYYQGSVVSLGNGHVYVSKTDNNTGNDPSLDTTETNWIVFPTPQDLRDGLALKVDRAGDTMTGDLTIAHNNFPRLILSNTNTNIRYNIVNSNDGQLVLQNAQNGRGLYLEPSVGDRPCYYNGTTGYQLINTYDCRHNGWGFPNWNGMFQIPNGWGASSNGIALVHGDIGGYGTISLYINGVEVWCGGVSENSRRHKAGNCVVTVGDWISVGYTQQVPSNLALYFVPMNGAD